MIVVTNTNDDGPGSLRAAIAAAALNEEITFAITGIITLTTAELLITQNVTISGPGSSQLKIHGDQTFRVFNTNTGVINISGLTVASGAGPQGAGIHNEATLNLVDVNLLDCESEDDGGGIWNSGTVVMAGDITNCSAAAGNGGAVHNSGTFTGHSLFILRCSASNSGGGVYNDFGTYTQVGGRISECTTASGHGGGMFTTGTVELTQVSVNNNDAAGNGDGILCELSTLTLTRCAVYLNDQCNIQSNSADITINNSTLSGGGTVISAIQMQTGAVLTLNNSTITQHGSGIHATADCDVTLYDSIIAGNDENDLDVFTASVTSLGNNALGVDSNEPVTEAPGDIRVLTYAALLVGPMQDNGGPTFTHALLETSPCVDAGNNLNAPATDQRGSGFDRIFNTTIDIGAFEFRGSLPPDPEPPGPEPEPPEPEPPTPAAPGATSIGSCRRVACCGENGVQFSDFQYSLVSGQTYTNSEFTLVVPCPVGYDCTAPFVTIVLPPGRVKFTPTKFQNPPKSGSGDPWDPLSGTYEFECGSQVLTITAVGAFSQAQIDAIINFLSTCQANQDGMNQLQPVPVKTPSGAPGIRLWNTEQSYTAECDAPETGDPVTVTIPANTYSQIIAQSLTPLQKYLAQQQLDADTLAQAALQAEAALECETPAVCPELKSSFLFNAPSRTWGAAYGLAQNLTYFSQDTLALALVVMGVDDADAVSISVNFGGDTTGSATMAYSELHNALYVGCITGGLAKIRVLSAAALTTVTDIDVSGLTPNTGKLTYFEDLDMVAATFDNNYIALIDCATNTVAASAADSNPQDCELAYVPANGQIYCPTDLTANPEITIRDATLAVLGSIPLPLGVGTSGIVFVPTDASISSAKLVTAYYDTEWRIVVVDPATDTIANTVSSGVVNPQAATAIAYDPTFHLVYLTAGDSLLVFSAITEEMICATSLADVGYDCQQIAVNTTTDRFYLPASKLSTPTRKYGQP